MSLIKGGGKAPVLISHQRQLSLSVTQVQGRNENEIFGNAQALCLWLQLSFGVIFMGLTQEGLYCHIF